MHLVGSIVLALALSADADTGGVPDFVNGQPAEIETQLEAPEEGDLDPPLEVPSRLTAPPISQAKPLPPEQDLLADARRVGDRLVVTRNGKQEVLTIDASLQSALTDVLKTYQTPYSAVVVLEPATGRVVAMAEHSQNDPAMRGLCTKAIYPAASVFKLVTASALLDAGVSSETMECYHGGKRKLTDRLLEDSERDRRCLPLSQALAMSANVVFAKLTRKYLSAEQLKATARAFHFNSPIDFPVPTDVSLAAIPDDPFGLSTAGAGFGDVYMSPLHGAEIAAVAANRGVWRPPVLFESALTAKTEERVVSEEHAAALIDMMQETVASGTAHRIFRQRLYRGEDAVGKTGSLADKKPFRDYSWFVGFAPKAAPKVAVAAVVVNEPYWRIRATWLGAEAMRLALGRQ
jgi:penicillin-binding protein A